MAKLYSYQLLNMLTGKLFIFWERHFYQSFSLMTWISGLLEDENIFPSKIGVPFPPTFRDTAFKIIKRLFRIYAHIYIRHLQVEVSQIYYSLR